ncbi:hypothetical protein BDF22DRAFT_776482 [Syncephalis plumigaleata]|nr:hypothetical protein BDF22DRAFT_776482 [Syncephalis plumigaleata]
MSDNFLEESVIPAEAMMVSSEQETTLVESTIVDNKQNDVSFVLEPEPAVIPNARTPPSQPVIVMSDDNDTSDNELVTECKEALPPSCTESLPETTINDPVQDVMLSPVASITELSTLDESSITTAITTTITTSTNDTMNEPVWLYLPLPLSPPASPAISTCDTKIDVNVTIAKESTADVIPAMAIQEENTNDCATTANTTATAEYTKVTTGVDINDTVELEDVDTIDITNDTITTTDIPELNLQVDVYDPDTVKEEEGELSSDMVVERTDTAPVLISVQESALLDIATSGTTTAMTASLSEGSTNRLAVPGSTSIHGLLVNNYGPVSPGISIFSHTSDEGGRSYSEDRFSLPGRANISRKRDTAKKANPWQEKVAAWHSRSLPLSILARVAHFSVDYMSVSFARTCRELYQTISRDDHRWKQSYIAHFPLNDDEIDWLRWCKAALLLQRQRNILVKGKLNTQLYYNMDDEWFHVYQRRQQLEANWCRGQNNSRTICIPSMDNDHFNDTSSLANGIATELSGNISPTSPREKASIEEPNMSVEVLLSNVWGFIIRVGRTTSRPSASHTRPAFTANTGADDWSDSDMDHTQSENTRIPPLRRRKPGMESTNLPVSPLERMRLHDDDTDDADVESDWEDRHTRGFGRRSHSQHSMSRRALLAQTASRARHSFHTRAIASLDQDDFMEGPITPDKFYYVPTLDIGYQTAYTPIELFMDADTPISIDEILLDDQFIAITYHAITRTRKASATLEELMGATDMNMTSATDGVQPTTCVWSVAALIDNDNGNAITLPYVSGQELRDGWLLATRHRTMDMEGSAKRVVYDLREPTSNGFRVYSLFGVNQACHLERAETSSLCSDNSSESSKRRIFVFKCDMVNTLLKYEYVEITAQPAGTHEQNNCQTFEQIRQALQEPVASVDVQADESTSTFTSSLMVELSTDEPSLADGHESLEQHEMNTAIDNSLAATAVYIQTGDDSIADETIIITDEDNVAEFSIESTNIDDNIIGSIVETTAECNNDALNTETNTTEDTGINIKDNIIHPTNMIMEVPRSTATPKPSQITTQTNPIRVVRQGEHALVRAPNWLTGDMLCTRAISMGRILIHPVYTDPDQPTWLCMINLVGRGQLLWECCRGGIIDIRVIAASDLIALHEDDGWALTGAHTGRDIAYAYTPQFSRGGGPSYPPEPVIGLLHWGEAIHPGLNNNNNNNSNSNNDKHTESVLPPQEHQDYGMEYELIDGITGHRRGPFPLRPAANRRFWTSAAHVIVWEMRAPEFLFLLDFSV